jgi:hypothetical protein
MPWSLLLSTLRRYLLPILIGVALAALLASHWWAYSQGKQGERVRQQAAQLAAEQRARKVQEALADELEAARQSRQVVVRERIRFVDRAVDPTGCLDVPLAPGLLDALRAGGRDG